MVHRLTREQAAAAALVVNVEVRLEATIQRMEVGIQSLIGQGGGFPRYRATSPGNTRRQLWVVVDSQGGTPSKPTFKELKKEAQRKAKVWWGSCRRMQPYAGVVAADRIERMEVDHVMEAMTQITGNMPARQDDAGGGVEAATWNAEHWAPTEEEYFGQWEEEVDEDEEGTGPCAAGESHMGKRRDDHEQYAADASDCDGALGNSGTGSGKETVNPKTPHGDAKDGDVDPTK